MITDAVVNGVESSLIMIMMKTMIDYKENFRSRRLARLANIATMLLKMTMVTMMMMAMMMTVMMAVVMMI